MNLLFLYYSDDDLPQTNRIIRWQQWPVKRLVESFDADDELAGSALLGMTERGRLPGLNRQVLLFLCHSLLFHIGLLGIADILLNFYLVSIGYDSGVISLLQALPRLSGFLIGLPVGLAANRAGNRRVMIVSTCGIAFCIAATALVPTLFLIALSRFFWGAFFGAGQVVKPPFMMTLTPPGEHTAQFSYHNLVSMMAVALGSALGGFIPTLASRVFSIEAHGGLRPEAMPAAYQAAIVIAALAVLLSVLPLLRLPSYSARAASAKSHRRQVIPWLKIVRLAFPLFVFGLSGGLTFPFFNLFFRDQFGMADSAVGSVIGLGWLVMGLAPLLNPFWEARLGRTLALTGLMAASAVAFAGLGLARGIVAAVIFYAMAIGLRNTMQPLFQPLLMDSLASSFHNIASSVGLALWNIGWFGATLCFGLLQSAFGHSHIMLIVAFLVLLNGVSIYAVHRRPTKKRTGATRP